MKFYFKLAESMIEKLFCRRKLFYEAVFRNIESLLKYNIKAKTILCFNQDIANPL